MHHCVYDTLPPCHLHTDLYIVLLHCLFVPPCLCCFVVLRMKCGVELLHCRYELYLVPQSVQSRLPAFFCAICHLSPLIDDNTQHTHSATQQHS